MTPTEVGRPMSVRTTTGVSVTNREFGQGVRTASSKSIVQKVAEGFYLHGERGRLTEHAPDSANRTANRRLRGDVKCLLARAQRQTRAAGDANRYKVSLSN